MSSSAYQPPADGPDASSGHVAVGGVSPKVLPFAQLGMRLLGVMLFVDGVATITGGAIQALFQARDYQAAGYSYMFDPHSAGWIASGIPYVLAGLYLAFDGRWILTNVLSLISREPADDPVSAGQRD